MMLEQNRWRKYSILSPYTTARHTKVKDEKTRNGRITPNYGVESLLFFTSDSNENYSSYVFWGFF